MNIARHIWKFFNKYAPHQGKQEKARRRKQIEKGMLKVVGGSYTR